MSEVDDLSYLIIKAALKVYNHMGYGFLESVYPNAMVIELTSMGLPARKEAPARVFYCGKPCGYFYADVIVDRRFVVELKAMENMPSTAVRQVKHYMRSLEIEDALVFNFAPERLEWKRIYP